MTICLNIYRYDKCISVGPKGKQRKWHRYLLRFDFLLQFNDNKNVKNNTQNEPYYQTALGIKKIDSAESFGWPLFFSFHFIPRHDPNLLTENFQSVPDSYMYLKSLPARHMSEGWRSMSAQLRRTPEDYKK